MTKNSTRVYLVCMALYWLVFGLITTFAPGMMDMFKTDTGKSAGTAFSTNVWMHGGMDIISISIILLTLSRENVSRNVLTAVAIVALMPAIAIFYSLATTPFWNSLFIGAGAGCLAFFIWGFVLVSRYKIA